MASYTPVLAFARRGSSVVAAAAATQTAGIDTIHSHVHGTAQHRTTRHKAWTLGVTYIDKMMGYIKLEAISTRAKRNALPAIPPMYPCTETKKKKKENFAG